MRLLHIYTYWESIYAADIVSDLRGVIDISNNLVVVPTEDITDETIASDIVDNFHDDFPIFYARKEKGG